MCCFGVDDDLLDCIVYLLQHMNNICLRIVINIAGNRMQGEIPSELGNLVSLNNLDIRKFVG